MEHEIIAADAEIKKIATTADGGINVVIGLGEPDKVIAAKLMQFVGSETLFEIEFKPKDAS